MSVKASVMLDVIQHAIQSVAPRVELRLVSNGVGSAPTPAAHCGECGEYETFCPGNWEELERTIAAFAKKHTRQAHEAQYYLDMAAK